MRLIKMLGLVAVAAAVVMAFVGASSAVAHGLCKSNHPLDECPLADQYKLPLLLDAKLIAGTHATLLAGAVGSVLCKKSEVEGHAEEYVGAGETGSILGKILAVTFEECELEGTKCEVTTEGLPYVAHLLLAIEKVKEPKDIDPLETEYQQHYHLVVLNGKAHVHCGALIDCKYGHKEILFHVRPLAEDVDLLVLQELEKENVSFICPPEAVWHAQYLLLALPEVGVSKPVYPAAKPLA